MASKRSYALIMASIRTRSFCSKTPSTEDIAKHDPYQGGEKEIGGVPVDIRDNLRERKGQVFTSRAYAKNWDKIFGRKDPKEVKSEPKTD
mmetsp:Transcript_19795/g.29595  ORF Transcript_19795/g.29595 Transcript_19795/m.29595 type:complete len:90 (-) Transcript_19795:204-473(-)